MRTLHHMVLCPFSRKVRFALEEKKIDFTLKEEKIENPSSFFESFNPSKKGPLLIDGDLTVAQDYSICEYLEEAYPSPHLLGETCKERIETRRLTQWFDIKFYEEVYMNIVYEKVIRRRLNQGGPNSQALRQGLSNIHLHLEYISWLSDRRRWLAGNTFSLADITAASHLSCVDYVGGILWERYPLAKDWYMRLKSRPSFRSFLWETMTGSLPVSHYAVLDF